MPKELPNGFSLIYDPDLLKQVIEFLKVGFFKWYSKKSAQVFRRLTSQKPELPRAAIYVDNGNIVIGILLFHQGWSKAEKKNIINLSSWYANHSHRGIEVILFAKNLTLALDKHIITNYTPSPAVCKILKAIKYKDMSVRQEFIGLRKTFPFIRLSAHVNVLTIQNRFEKPQNIEENKVVSEQADWLYKIDKIKKFGIMLSDLSLYSPKHNAKLPFIWLLMMIIKFRVVRVNYFIKHDNDSSSNVWLIKNSSREAFILPADSELSMSLGRLS